MRWFCVHTIICILLAGTCFADLPTKTAHPAGWDSDLDQRIAKAHGESYEDRKFGLAEFIATALFFLIFYLFVSRGTLYRGLPFVGKGRGRNTGSLHGGGWDRAWQLRNGKP